mgnify:CR=1 FL=1
MEDHPAMTAGELDASGRPVKSLPASQLIRLSLYWLGLTSIFSGLTVILQGRLVFSGLVPELEVGGALFLTQVGGAVIAMIVQPTVGTISDYTISRWGRRKPYILIGSVLDVLFLYGIATSNTVLGIAAFMVLLQFSSNFAQGPFQGYVPDLVPAQQVGLASALVGLFNVLGNVAGFLIGSAAVAFSKGNPDAFLWATMALGILELATMLSVVIRVDEGRTPRPRGGRSWLDVAKEAWGTDILGERSYLFLVGSRLFVLMGAGMLVNLGVIYLNQSHGLDQEATGTAFALIAGVVAVMTMLSVVPAARASDRFGRKPVIYVSCAVGVVGLALAAVAPSVPVAFVGAAIMGAATGIFLAVDWALLTDIIPKATTGRYMGISNVATASSGVLAIAFGGQIIDRVNALVGIELGLGPRAAIAFGVACYVIGALLLRPVVERRREDTRVAAVVVAETAG